MARPETGLIVLAENGQTKINIGISNYLYCYDQTGLVEVDLLRGNELVETHMVERLLNLPGKLFDTIVIRNRHNDTNTVRFFFGRGGYVPNADRSVVVIDDAVPPVFDLAEGATVNLEGSSVTVASAISNTGTAIDDVTVSNSAILLAAADVGDRLELMISIPETESNGIRIGGADVTATKGGYIPAGSIVFIPFESALYAIRDGSNDVNVTITALRRI